MQAEHETRVIDRRFSAILLELSKVLCQVNFECFIVTPSFSSPSVCSLPTMMPCCSLPILFMGHQQAQAHQEGHMP